jgi:hypothetical protein
VANLAQKMLAIYKEVQSVQKNAEIKAGYSSYKAVLHDDVTRLLHMPMANNGIICLTDVISHNLIEMHVERQGKPAINYRSEVSVKVILINADEPTDTLEITSHSFAVDSGDKCYGKAVSMATKYALLKAFMLESRDEEESREVEPIQPPKPSAVKNELKKILTEQGKFTATTQSWLNSINDSIAQTQLDKLKKELAVEKQNTIKGE